MQKIMKTSNKLALLLVKKIQQREERNKKGETLDKYNNNSSNSNKNQYLKRGNH